MNKNALSRCPACNSTAVRKREMIVKTGSYNRYGGSIGLNKYPSPRIFGSRGKNDWVGELAPMSYFWPILLAVILVGLFEDKGMTIGYWATALFNVAWFFAAYGDSDAFKKEWACSKCGNVWDPSISVDPNIKARNAGELKGV